MKRYQSHKIVEAAPIIGTTEAKDFLSFDDGSEFGGLTPLPEGFCSRGTPSPGDYLVRYQPDGYLSWSPKAVFEAGYSLIEDKPAGRGTPACVEVTVSAPAGKRAEVALHSGPVGSPMRWTVAPGQTQSWAVVGSEYVTASQADTSTVAHKRETD